MSSQDIVGDAEEHTANDDLQADDQSSSTPWYRRDTLASVLVISLLVWWATKLTWGAGGHDPYVLSVACVLAIGALALVQPWKRLSNLTMGLAVAISVVVWIVVLTAPTGLNGANAAATYVIAAATLLIVAAWATCQKRMSVVIGIVLAACFFEFAQAFWVWLGSANSTTPLVGTIYYLNSFGTVMIPGVLLGMVVALGDSRMLRLLGMVVAPLSIVAVVYSTSKGSQLLMVLGSVAIAVVLGVVYRWRGVLGAVVIWALGAALCFIVTGPPFFSTEVARLLPGGSTVARTGTIEGAAVSVTGRLDWWGDTLAIFLHWPITGSGFHSLNAASLAVGRPFPSAFAHNGFLQALAEGGLVLAIPVWAACIAIVIVVVRWIYRALKHRKHALEAGIAITVLTLMLHSGMDFDWSYPTLTMMFAILAGLIIPKRSLDATPLKPYLGWCLTGIVIASLVASTIAAWGGNWNWNFPV